MGEIIPVNAESSKETKKKFSAANALDLNLSSLSEMGPDSNGAVWLKISLDQVYVLEKIVWLTNQGTPRLTWTWSNSDFSCDSLGIGCASFSLIISIESGAAPANLNSISERRYGDIIKFQRTDGVDKIFVFEIAIIGKRGEIII